MLFTFCYPTAEWALSNPPHSISGWLLSLQGTFKILPINLENCIQKITCGLESKDRFAFFF